jgi:hypothetical protein
MSHGDPDHPDRNPHPVQRYEIIATAEAPGPWDSVKGYISYDVVNQECTRENKFLGVHILPRDVGLDIEMTRVDEKTWKGYFYRDYLNNDDYYGLGTCRWDATSVAAVFVVHSRSFSSGDTLSDLVQKGSQTEHFKRSDFLDRAPTPYGARFFSATDPEYVKDQDAFFPVRIAVKEASP